MKKYTKRCARLFLGIMVLMCPVTAVSGGQEGHGGDAYALEFVALGKILAKALEEGKIRILLENPKDFSIAVKETTVHSVDRDVLNESEVDAINYPFERVIKISRIRWKQYENDLKKKLSLVLHEYLGIIGKLDRHYELSDQYVLELFQMISYATLNDLVRRELNHYFMTKLDELVHPYFLKVHCGGSSCLFPFSLRPKNGPWSQMLTPMESQGRYQAFIVKERLIEGNCILPDVRSTEDLVSLSQNSRNGLVEIKPTVLRDLSDCVREVKRRASAN